MLSSSSNALIDTVIIHLRPSLSNMAWPNEAASTAAGVGV
jgi:hypothetical protein